MSDTRTIQITTRVGSRILARAEHLREFVGREVGSAATRADVIRRAIALGLRELERRRSRDVFDGEAGAVSSTGEDVT